MNETLLILACLYSQVHISFYKVDMVVYDDAIVEVATIAHSLGYNLNDLAKVATYK